MSSGSYRPHFSLNDDEFYLPLLSRGSHASIDGSSKIPPKKDAPNAGNGVSGVFFFMSEGYSTFSAKIKALTCRERIATVVSTAIR